MAEHDFSHLFSTPQVLADTLEHGYRVTDENWLLTVELIEPALLTKSELSDLRYILDPAIERRGGKSVQLLSKPLIEKLGSVERRDIPVAFLAGLMDRLRNGERYTKRESNRDYSKRFWRGDRDRIIVYLYDYIADRLNDDSVSVSHDIFGDLAIPLGPEPRSEKALAMLHGLLSERTVYDAPSTGTLMKILAQDPHRKRRAKR